MGVNSSKTIYQIFQYFNEIHVAAGSGILGFIFCIYRGIKTDSFKIVCVSGITMGSLLYLLSSTKHVPPSKEKIVIITGCDSGLGFSLAQHTCDLGFTVIAACLNPQSDGAKELVRKYEKRICTIELDLTKEFNIQNALTMIENYLIINDTYELWAVVNNAGVMVFGEFEWLTDRLVKQQLDVNIYGTMIFTKALLPLVRKYQARIITISSHCANATLPGLSVYGATKAALAGWFDGLRVEQQKYGVSIINFIPGSFVAQSNIMAKQNENVFEMQSAMTQEQLSFYGDYFKEYNAYLSALSGKRKLKKIIDYELYEVFNDALLDIKPSAVYVHESWKYKIFHILFKITPYCVRDRLIVYFIQMPQWKRNRHINHISNAIG